MRLTRGFYASTRVLSAKSKPVPSTHNDIKSFLEYAQEVNLPPVTTVFHGTLYEYTVLRALSCRVPYISLSKTGGRGDKGIDLTGTWTLPTVERETFPLLVQCKAEKNRRGPVVIRELEGVLAGRPMRTMGIVASIGECTPGMRNAMLVSRQPIGFVKVTPLDVVIKEVQKRRQAKKQQQEESMPKTYTVQFTGKGGLLQQFVWNAAASRILVEFGVTLRHIPTEDNYLEQEIALMYKGLPLPDLAVGIDDISTKIISIG